MIKVTEIPLPPHPSAADESRAQIPSGSEAGLQFSLTGIANRSGISSLLSPLVSLLRDVPAGEPLLSPDHEDLLVMRVANAERADTPHAVPSSMTGYAMGSLASWANDAVVANLLGRVMADLPSSVVMPGGLLHALWRGDFASGLLHALSLLPTHVMPEQMVTDVAHAIRTYVLDYLGSTGSWLVGEEGEREKDYLGSMVVVASIALAIAHQANLFGRPGAGPGRAGERIVDGMVATARGLLSLRGFVQTLLPTDRHIADTAIEGLRQRADAAKIAYEAADNADDGRRLRHIYRVLKTDAAIALQDRLIASTGDPVLKQARVEDRLLLEERRARLGPRTPQWLASQRSSRGHMPDPRNFAENSRSESTGIDQVTVFAKAGALTDLGVFTPGESPSLTWGAAAARGPRPRQDAAVQSSPRPPASYPPAVSLFLLRSGAAKYGIDENTKVRCDVLVDTGERYQLSMEEFSINIPIGAAMTGAIRETLLQDDRLTDEGIFRIDYTWPLQADRGRSRDQVYQEIKRSILRAGVVDSVSGVQTERAASPLEVSRVSDAEADISNPEVSPGENGPVSEGRTRIDLTDSGIVFDRPAPDIFLKPRSKKNRAPQKDIDTSQTAGQAAVAAAGGTALGVDGTTELVVDIEGVHSHDPWRSQRTYHATLGQILGGNVWDAIREQMREGELTISYAIPGKDKGGAAYQSFFQAMLNATVVEPEELQDTGRLAFPEKILYSQGILEAVDTHAGQLPHLAVMYPFATQLPELQAEEARLKADYERYEAEIARLAMRAYGDWKVNEVLEQNRALRDNAGVSWRAVSVRSSRLQGQAQRHVIAQYIGESPYNVVGRFPAFDLPADKAVRVEIAYADGSRQIRVVEIEDSFRYASDWQAQVANATNGHGDLVAGQLRPDGWVVPSFSTNDRNEFRIPHGSNVIDVSVTEMDSPRYLAKEWSRLSLRNLSLVYEDHVARNSIVRLDTAIGAHEAVLARGSRRRPVEAVAKKYRESIASLRRLRQSTLDQVDTLAASMEDSRNAIAALETRMVAASIPPFRRRGEKELVQGTPGDVVLGMDTSIEVVEKTGHGSMDAVLQAVVNEALGVADGSKVSLDTKCRFTYTATSRTPGNFATTTEETRFYSIREIMLGVVNREESAAIIGRIANTGTAVAESGCLPDKVGQLAKMCVSQQAAANHPRSRVAAMLEEKVRELGANGRLRKGYGDFSRQRLYGIVQRIAKAGGDAEQLAMLWLSGVVDPQLVMHRGQVVPGIVAIGSAEMSLLVSLENGRSTIFQRTLPSSDLASFVRGHLSLFDQAVMADDGAFLPSSHLRADPPFSGMDSGSSYRTYEPNPNIAFRYVPDLFDKLWEAKVGQLRKNVNSHVYTPAEEQVYLDAVFWRKMVTLGMFAALPLIAVPGGAGIFIEIILGAGFGYLGAIPERTIAANADRGELFRQATTDAANGHRFLQWKRLLGVVTLGRLLWRGGGFVFSGAISPARMQAFVDANYKVTFQGGDKGFVYRGFVFRGDTRTTATIFKDGFKLREPILDIGKVNGKRGGFGGGRNSLDPDGNGISASAFYRRDSAGAFYYGGDKGGFTYVVDARAENGFHLYANHHWAKHPSDTAVQLLPWEVNYAKDIPGPFVVGAYDARDNFIPNPDYICLFG
jgi:hypothetical protein